MRGRHRPLTARQAEALRLFRAFCREHGRGPSLREFAPLYGATYASARSMLEALVRRGRLKHTEDPYRIYALPGEIRIPGYVEQAQAADGFVVAVLYADPAQADAAAEGVRARLALYERAAEARR